jgi:hypothetical protein
MQYNGNASKNDDAVSAGESCDDIMSLQGEAIPQSRIVPSTWSETSIASAMERGGSSVHGSLLVLTLSYEDALDSLSLSVVDSERAR